MRMIIAIITIIVIVIVIVIVVIIIVATGTMQSVHAVSASSEKKRHTDMDSSKPRVQSMFLLQFCRAQRSTAAWFVFPRLGSF